jgi:hypothetical protein
MNYWVWTYGVTIGANTAAPSFIPAACRRHGFDDQATP